MITAILAFAKLAFGGIFGFLKTLPWQAYAAAGVAIVGWRGYVHIDHSAFARGQAAKVAELGPKLTALQSDLTTTQANLADTLGLDLAHKTALDKCVGNDAMLATYTSAILTSHRKEQDRVEKALTKTREELRNAYAQSTDMCANSTVPAAVIRLLNESTKANADTDNRGQR